jgi:hypothetical protein
MNRFMERETLANLSGPKIFTNSDSPSADRSSHASEEGIEGRRADNPSREHAYGSNVPNAHVSISGMNTAKSSVCDSEHSLESNHAQPGDSYGVSGI